MTLREAIVSCCRETGWTPNQVRDHSLAQIFPFISRQEKFNDVVAAQSRVSQHNAELTRMARAHLEAWRNG